MGRRSALLTVLLVVLLASAPAVFGKTVSSHTEKSFKVIPGGSVVVEVSFHDVQVSVRPGDELRVTVDLEVRASAAKADKILAALEPQFTSSGNTITMRSSESRGFRFGVFDSVHKDGRVEILLPPEMNLEVDLASGDCQVTGDLGRGKLLLDSASGEVSLDGGADHIVVDTASGDAVLTLARPAVSVLVDTASGDVTLRGGAMELSVDTASGSVWASDLLGAASFDTASGDVKAQWSAVPVGVKVTADTASGSVRLRLPRGTVVGGSASTASGRIETDLAGQLSDRGRHFRFQGGAGELRLKLDTASGDIAVLSD